jgi:hypothetical protein
VGAGDVGKATEKSLWSMRSKKREV